MSYLLTSGKKHGEKSKEMNKKPKKSVLTGGPGESSSRIEGIPTTLQSSASVAVWKCILDDVEITVTFYKDKNQVFCNGSCVQTSEGFDEGDTPPGMYSTEPGSIIDFIISSARLRMTHSARIQRLAQSSSSVVGSHTLTVDNCLIPEYNSSQSIEPTNDQLGYDEFEEDGEEDANDYMSNAIQH